VAGLVSLWCLMSLSTIILLLFTCRHDGMVVGFTLPMQSVPITTKGVNSNLDQGEVYNIM
jgi:hypothetical protein